MMFHIECVTCYKIQRIMNIVTKENFKKDFAEIWWEELGSVEFSTSSIKDKDLPFRNYILVV